MSPNQKSEENINTKAILEASTAVFKEERTRWLIGKGEHLLRTGKLTEEKFNELLDKVLKDEIDRKTLIKINS
jgi:hypothetical protein